MARRPNPWFWDQKQEYCVTINGKRHRLGADKDEAYEKFYALMGEKPAEASTDSVWGILDKFLEWTEKNRPASYDWYRKRLQRFKDSLPNMQVQKLKPFHIQQWLDKQTWGDNYKRGMVTAIKRAFNWAVKSGHISNSPIAFLEKPEAEYREQLIAPAEFKRILAMVKDDNFRDILEVIWLTGCRPQEACTVQAHWIEKGYWQFPKKKSKGKKRERLVFLAPKAERITKKWAKLNPTGPIFRNRRGNGWTAFAFSNRFARLQEKIGYKVAMYSIRHSFAHHGLTKGDIDPVVMASLLGHNDTTMLMKVYGHLLKDTKFMQAAAKKALSR